MKLSHLAYAGVGYVLGARAGRERYEQIVRVSRRVAGSQTVQSTAGVVQARVDHLTAQARHAVTQRLGGAAQRPPATDGHAADARAANGRSANGHRPG